MKPGDEVVKYRPYLVPFVSRCVERNCEQCGKPFQAIEDEDSARIPKRFCSNACRQRAYRERKRSDVPTQYPREAANA
jgi:hypothetical protein